MLHNMIIVMGVDPQMAAFLQAKFHAGSEEPATAPGSDSVDRTVGRIAEPRAIIDLTVCRIFSDIKEKHAANLILILGDIQLLPCDIRFQCFPGRVGLPPLIGIAIGSHKSACVCIDLQNLREILFPRNSNCVLHRYHLLSSLL